MKPGPYTPPQLTTTNDQQTPGAPRRAAVHSAAGGLNIHPQRKASHPVISRAKLTSAVAVAAVVTTGHAESVEITFDPKKITYGKLLQIFFSVAHNPTQLNFQGPDHGTQYRSAIFTTNDEQKSVAAAYVAQIDAAKVFPAPIVTEVRPLAGFYPAEDYHQDYATLHPERPYIARNDLPKIENFKVMFPDVWCNRPKLVFAANAS